MCGQLRAQAQQSQMDQQFEKGKKGEVVPRDLSYEAPRNPNHEAPTKKPCKQVYVLEVVNDTPYHEGTEFWCETSLKEIVAIIEFGFDWINQSEATVSLRTFGEKDDVIIANSWDDEIPLNNIQVSKYPDILGQFPNHIYCCGTCSTLFSRKLQQCELCQGQCESILDDNEATAQQ